MAARLNLSEKETGNMAKREESKEEKAVDMAARKESKEETRVEYLIGRLLIDLEFQFENRSRAVLTRLNLHKFHHEKMGTGDDLNPAFLTAKEEVRSLIRKIRSSLEVVLPQTKVLIPPLPIKFTDSTDPALLSVTDAKQLTAWAKAAKEYKITQQNIREAEGLKAKQREAEELKHELKRRMLSTIKGCFTEKPWCKFWKDQVLVGPKSMPTGIKALQENCENLTSLVATAQAHSKRESSNRLLTTQTFLDLVAEINLANIEEQSVTALENAIKRFGVKKI